MVTIKKVSKSDQAIFKVQPWYVRHVTGQFYNRCERFDDESDARAYYESALVLDIAIIERK